MINALVLADGGIFCVGDHRLRLQNLKLMIPEISHGDRIHNKKGRQFDGLTVAPTGIEPISKV